MRRIGTQIVLACAGLALLAPATARAQGEQASIVGVVQDSSGAVMPGVTVEAASPALIEQVRSVVTDAAGRYAIVNLRPGTYTVSFTLQGFRTVRREGIVLEGAFAATVNATLQVGAVEETITVTGSSPVVDLQNTRAQVVVNQDILQALPVMRSIQDQANLVPGVISHSTSAGQILSDFYINSMQARGSTDQHITIDGMHGGNMLLGSGTQAIAGGVNELGQAEMVYDVGSHTAEYATAGVQMDAIPKDGGNRFEGTYRFFGSTKGLQSSNLTDELRAAGITDVNKLDFNWDSNIAVGGPIRRNKVWFFSALELSQFNILVANVYFPDGTQADTGGGVKPNGTARITSQLSEKDKFSFAYNNTTSLTERYDFNATTTPEAGLRVRSPINYTGIAKWTRTATSRLLLEVGQSVSASTYIWEYQPEVGPFDVSHYELATGVTTVASGIAPVSEFNRSFNTVANVSYVTGSHAIKTGMSWTAGRNTTTVEPHGDIVRLITFNGRGSNITVRNSPVTGREHLNADLGIFAQDKWTRDRLTVNYGARYDYLNASVPDQTAPAGRFVPAREAAAISCVPCWNDWSIRAGATYDLFGDGRTALKATVGKYLTSALLNVAQSVNPIRSRSETRAWTDLDGNGTALNPDGTLQTKEVGPARNVNFGTPEGSTRFDPNTPRPSNWEETVSVTQEVTSGIAVTAGYYHRHYQNLSITRNLAVDPVDGWYPYTLTAPTDPRLPGGGGEVITQYNLKPELLGLSDTVSTYSTENTRVYNGFEVSVNARLPQGGFLLGGVTTERTATNSCDISDPNDLLFCDVTPPFRTLYKLSGGYTLPYDVQLSGSLQAVPGSDIGATYSYNSLVAGVPLTGGGTRSVQLVEPDTQFYDYNTQLDLRVAKSFRFGAGRRVQAYMDIFNILNASTVVSVNQTYGNNWLNPLVVMQARRLQLGARFDF
jgi:hypothetical protein